MDESSAVPAQVAKPGASRSRKLTMTTADLIKCVDGFGERVEALKKEVRKVVVGQNRVLDQILIALLADGHVLLEGVPGLAKTLIVNTLARTLSLQFGRVQFTPDLMPSDITGTQIVRTEISSGARRFEFQRGPVFVNVLLADEINRSPPRTQAALLEGMAERHVTVGGRSLALPKPFFVLATQNPLEQEGTYPLPEAQLDRFLMKIKIEYPTHEEEHEIVRSTTTNAAPTPEAVLTLLEIVGMQHVIRALPVSSHIVEYATRLVRATRPASDDAPEWVRHSIAWGGSPRGVQALLLSAKASALLKGRFSVTRETIRDVALPVLRHRIVPSFRGEGEGLDSDDLVCRLLLETTPFSPMEMADVTARRILRR